MARPAKELLWSVVERPLAASLYVVTRAVLSTSHVYRVGPGARVAGNAIYVSWHADLPLLVAHFGARHARMMISGAPYMRPIRRLCGWLGLGLVVGTSGAGGRAALSRLVEEAARGADVYLSVDGPAGPALRVKPGCVTLAKATGLPIVPVAVRSRRPLPVPGRWDGMVLHLPVNALEVLHGPPLILSDTDDDEDALARVQAALDDVFARAQAPRRATARAGQRGLADPAQRPPLARGL